MAFCRQCGNAMGDSDRFCRVCGQTVSEGAQPDAPAAYAPPAYAARGRKKGLWISLGAAVALVAVACILVFVVFKDDIFGGSDPEQTVRQMLEASEKGDGAALVALLSPESLRFIADEEGVTVGEMKASLAAEITEEYATETLEFRDVELVTEMGADGRTATVRAAGGTVTVTVDDGSPETVDLEESGLFAGGDVSLILIDGTWYIDLLGAASGQGQKSDDAAAKSLIRNSMTAIESGYVDVRTFDPAVLTPEFLADIEPSITFIVSSGLTEACSAPSAETSADAVEYYGDTSSYAVGSVSESGRSFGVLVDKGAGGGNYFYIDGVAQEW